MSTVKPNYALWEINPNNFPKKDLKDQLTFICSYGHLSPSSHNTQPWHFIIKGSTIEVHADLKFRLPAADPTNKELFISVGSTIPNLEIAATRFGFKHTTLLFPTQKDHNHVATIQLEKVQQTIATSYFPQITKRLTNRSLYKKNTRIPEAVIQEMQTGIAKYQTSLEIYSGKYLPKLAKITKDSMFNALSNLAFRTELSHWVRHNWTDKGDGLPGNTLGLPDAASVVITTLVRSPMMATTTSILEEKMIKSSSAVGILFTDKKSDKSWIKAGMAFTILSLVATKHKVAIAPLSGAIEMQAQRQELLEFLHESREPMMFFRMGYAGKKYPHAPRRPLAEVVTIK